MRLHPSTRARFAKIVPTLLAWHSTNRRSFIWRGLKRSPYIVMVSEFMLQQTSVKQVEKHLPAFLKKFPTVRNLAAASRPEVIRAWHGLGYNRRAINLHEAAKAIASKRQFPKTLEELRALPGVGLYTASAILAFAHNADLPVVDVNIERVLSRLWKRMPDTHAALPMPDIHVLDGQILPAGRSADWHEALMDLGSTICTKHSPCCEVCPLHTLCPSAGKLKAPIETRRSREPIHFGQPRRIWRGRILKVVTEAGIAKPKELSRHLQRQFRIRDRGFTDFVLSVLNILQAEGFLDQSKQGAYCLADHP